MLPHAPQPGQWLDLGSGGGFPGLVVAIQRSEKGLGPVHLVESNGRKCAFLRHCVRLLDLDAVVHERRIEDYLATSASTPEVVSARALAPLAVLIGWTQELLRRGALGIFPKGQDVDRDIAEAARQWTFTAELQPSVTDRQAHIVLVRMKAEEDTAHVAG